MKRNLLLNQLFLYKPIQEEIETKKKILHFIQEHADCFERSLPIGHITASCWLLDSNQTHALLMRHAKLKIWCQPGGHCDGEHDTLAVALKEAREESGIPHIIPVSNHIFDLDIHLIPILHLKKHTITTIYATFYKPHQTVLFFQTTRL